MLQKRFKLHISLHYANIEQNAFSWLVVDSHVSFKMVGEHITLLLPYSINNDRHTLTEESSQTNVILQYKLLAAVCSVIRQS